jgi:hypothetical protein
LYLFSFNSPSDTSFPGLLVALHFISSPFLILLQIVFYPLLLIFFFISILPLLGSFCYFLPLLISASLSSSFLLSYMSLCVSLLIIRLPLIYSYVGSDSERFQVNIQ